MHRFVEIIDETTTKLLIANGLNQVRETRHISNLEKQEARREKYRKRYRLLMANPEKREARREKCRKRYHLLMADPEKRKEYNRRQRERYYAQKELVTA